MTIISNNAIPNVVLGGQPGSLLPNQTPQTPAGNVGDGFVPGDQQPWNNFLTNLGIEVVDPRPTLSKFTEQQLSGLSALGAGATRMTDDQVRAQFRGIIESGTGIEYQDVNALVQQVLREAYIQNTEDLRLYAQKVKFYNNVRKTLRDELARAREAMTAAGPGDPEMELSAPFTPNHVYTTFTGGTDVVTVDGADAKVGRSADAAFTASSFGGDWVVTSGNRWDPLAVDLDGDGAIRTIDTPQGVMTIGATNEDRSRTGRTGSMGLADGQVTSVTSAGALTTVNENRRMETRFTQWFDPSEGIVVMDRNGDGQIQANELFGDRTVTGRDVDTGYEDLALLDSNNDGAVDFRDEQFSELRIWQDQNSDGVVQEGELSTMFANDITALSTQGVQGAAQGEDSSVIMEGSEFVALEGAKFTKGELEDYIKAAEDQLNTVGDDAQLANIDLQNMLQKQQQTLQMMSNISKSLHDTAMSIIRKMAG